MDVHAHLHYQYPTTVNPVLLHLPQQQSHAQPHPQHQETPIPHHHIPTNPMATAYHNLQQVSSRVRPNATNIACGQAGTSQQQILASARRAPVDHSSAFVHTDSLGTCGPSSMSDKYIPSSSDKITCADHRPLDEIFGNPFTPSSWPPSGSRSSRVPQPHPQSHQVPPYPYQGQPQQLSYPYGHSHSQPHQQAPQILTYALPSKSQLGGILHIPLLAVDNQKSGTNIVIGFRCSDWGTGVQMEGESNTRYALLS